MQTRNSSNRVKAPDLTNPKVQVYFNHEKDDGVALNPVGRVTFDDKSKRIKFLNCKTYKNIGTINVRTLRIEGKKVELVNNFMKYNLSILGIIDHKIVHEDEPTRIEEFKDCTRITTSAWRNTNGASCGGVGLIVSKEAEKSLAEIIPVNKRIMVALFDGNSKTSLVINYARRRKRRSRRTLPQPVKYC